jgi:hypothetical protein
VRSTVGGTEQGYRRLFKTCPCDIYILLVYDSLSTVAGKLFASAVTQGGLPMWKEASIFRVLCRRLFEMAGSRTTCGLKSKGGRLSEAG